MTTRRDEQMQRLEEFLSLLDRLQESGAVFSSTVLKRDIAKAIRDRFSDRPCATLDDSLGIKEKIDEVIFASLKEGKPLFISVSVQTSPLILRRLEQLLKDGYVEENTPGGRRKLTPAKGWFSVVWVDSSSIKEQEFPLKELFGYKLAL